MTLSDNEEEKRLIQELAERCRIPAGTGEYSPWYEVLEELEEKSRKARENRK